MPSARSSSESPSLPWEITPAPRAEDLNRLPAHAQVVVVGGGLAGLAVAAFLAEGGAEVVLLEARERLADGASGRGLGLALQGLDEHPQRLVAAMGLEAARAIYHFSAEGIALLDGLGLLARTGSVAAAAAPVETDADLVESVSALREIGVGVEPLSAGEVNRRLGGAGLGAGRLVPGDGQFDPGAVAGALARRASVAEARLFAGARAIALRPAREGTEIVVQTNLFGSLTMTADAVVLAGGADLIDLDPFFAQVLTPIRLQAIALAPGPPPLPCPVTLQHRYTQLRPTPAGGLLAAGCRWATPHMEVGERDDTVIEPRVDARLRELVARVLPAWARAPVTARWSTIQAYSCDGLPLVGPLPGRPRVLAAAGWNGCDAAFALRAARAVADGLLTGRAEGVPAFFAPGRMA